MESLAQALVTPTSVELSSVGLRLILGLIFLWASLAKLRRLSSLSATLVDFGVPLAASPGLSLVLPLLEGAIGAMLLAGRSVPTAAFLALILLVVFSLAIAVHLVLGHKPRCNCFGERTAGPISWWTLVRNCTLAVMALAVARTRPVSSIEQKSLFFE